jgi:hypothetical protein
VVGRDAPLSDAVDRLVAAELVFRRGPRLIFKHALVQDVAYQSLLRGRRTELHGRIAEALLGRFPERGSPTSRRRWRIISSMPAGRTAAIDYYGRAAELANNKGANKEARRYMERSLLLIEGLPEGAERVRREIQALTTIGRIGVALEGHGSSAAAEAFGRGLTLCREAGLDAAELPLLVGLIVQLSVSGATSEALALGPRLWISSSATTIRSFVSRPATRSASPIPGAASWPPPTGISRRSAALCARPARAPSRHLRPGSGRGRSLPGRDDALVHGPCRAGCPRHRGGGRARPPLGHPFSINYALTWYAMHALETEPAEVAKRAIDASLDYAAEQAFMTWLSMGQRASPAGCWPMASRTRR